MTLKCPKCNSLHIASHDIGKKTCTIVGTVGGTLGGAVATLSGARVGGTVGAFAGPVGIAAGSVLGAIVGGLIGGTTGGMAGARLGKIVDERLLENFECLSCGHTFKHDDLATLSLPSLPSPSRNDPA